MSLPVKEQERALRQAALAWHWRNNQDASREQIAERLHYGSVEALRGQFEKWGIPSWVVGEELETNSTPNKDRKKRTPRLRNFGPGKDLPSAGNATALFKERLEALVKTAELLSHMDERLHGRYFVRQDVETATVLLSRDFLPEEEWKKLCEQHDLDPDDEYFADPNALAILPGGVALSPSEAEAMLIGVYALAGGDMDALLDVLHPDPSSVDAQTRDEIRQYVEGSRPDDKINGLKVLAHQLASWVRGSEIKQGRPSRLSKADHAFACAITHYRKQGLTDEEIARKEYHRRTKEDGTSYTIKDVTELGDLGLSWP